MARQTWYTTPAEGGIRVLKPLIEPLNMSNQSRAYRSERHVHKFIKVKDDRISLWRCASRYCNYTLYPKQELFLIGQATTCWNCDHEFAMSVESLKEDLPLCPSCRMTTEEKALADLLELEESQRK